MDLISTKELSEKWNVSISRIVRLAKAGRIPGAVLIGKSWVFPPDTKKPVDNRRRENKAASQSDVAKTSWHFPLYHYCNYSSEEIENEFSEDERILYEGERLHLIGEYKKSNEMLAKLFETTQDRYVKFGALYYLCVGSINLMQGRDAYRYENEFVLLYSAEEEHQKEIAFIAHNLETWFVGNTYYIEELALNAEDKYPEHMRDYILLECAYAQVLRAFAKGISVDPNPFVLFGQTEGATLSALSAQTLHVYAALLQDTGGHRDRAITHIQMACRLAEENNLEHSIVAYMIQYKQDLYKAALQDVNPDQLKRLKSISYEANKAYQNLLDNAGKGGILQILEVNDAPLIHLASRHYTNKEIAGILKISQNTVGKRFSVLFEKTGAHSRKELVHLYEEALRKY